MNKTVLVINGESRYNVLRVATERIAEGFRQKGYRVEMMDLMLDADRAIVKSKMVQESYAFIFSCQALLFDTVQEDGTPFLELVKSPYIGWIFDDLLYHLHRVLNQRYQHSWLLSVDNETPNIIGNMFPELRNFGGLAHGGFAGEDSVIEKDIDVLFPGTIGTKPTLENIIKDPMPIERVFASETIKKLNEKPWLSVRKALEIVVQEFGEELTGDLLAELSNVILYVDAYIRYQYKYQIMEVLLKNGINLHVVGEGNNDLLDKYKDCITVCGGKDIEEVVELMQRSKIVLNPFPNIFYKGAHERVFTAMLSRSVCFTPYSEYVNELLNDNVKYIDMNNLQYMADEMKNILTQYNQDNIQKFLRNAYECAISEHTWEMRGRQIVEFYEEVFLNE